MSIERIVVHGGAGGVDAGSASTRRALCEQAALAGWGVLRGGGAALDAVIEAVVLLEDHPLFNAGVGSCLNEEGRVEMDASVMDGPGARGAGVAVVTTVPHPVLLARAVLDEGRHVLLAGPGADGLARRLGWETMPPDHFVTERQRARWRSAVSSPGTVGAVGLDRRGRLAAATSTGGLPGKRVGRIGDSAVLGAGTFADESAAASATGDGEAILLLGLTRLAADLCRDGRDPGRAMARILGLLRAREVRAGLILVDRFGRIACGQTTEEMITAVLPR